MRHEFTEVLNDLIDYFLLADIRALLDFSVQKGLPADLATEFTMTESADRAVEAGALLPIPGVENLPYTVAFVTAPDEPELLAPTSHLVHRGDAYALHVEHGSLELFTWHILGEFTESTVGALLERYRQSERPRIAIENGWYRVDVLAGWLARDDGPEPAFELVLTPAAAKPAPQNTDLGRRYALSATDLTRPSV
ncbi:hypothetical protein [Gordonia hydrophobica]|uniref:Uncharacterized protein n=1 Tax=Gordonia hydrophobica TaxID=40516 RepID=A0ABZ2U4F9_9ACTN|nr:hypothetical protein [Gordonia hydrophobica]MBM7367512.1 hypothetical protein [Gordonia hydrophobica]